MNDKRKDAIQDLTNLEYTVHARRSMEKVTRDPYFRDDDPDMIDWSEVMISDDEDL